MITLYTTTTCGFCKMVKQFLTMKGADFELVNLDEQPDRQEEAINLSGVMSVPVTTNGSAVVVGWNPAKLMELL